MVSSRSFHVVTCILSDLGHQLSDIPLCGSTEMLTCSSQWALDWLLPFAVWNKLHFAVWNKLLGTQASEYVSKPPLLSMLL